MIYLLKLSLGLKETKSRILTLTFLEVIINRGLMRAGLAPVVILVEERAAYMDLLARSDYDGLAAMLRRLSEAETERIERFAEL